MLFRSMEEFNSMMDTLAMQPQKSKSNPCSNNENEHIVDVTLRSSDFSAQLRNMNNGIGIASYSAKGLRDTQEDRCCLVPDAADYYHEKNKDNQNNQKENKEKQKDNTKENQKNNDRSSGKDGKNGNDITDDNEILHKLTVACLFDGHSGSVCSEYLNKHFAKMLVHHDKFLEKSPEAALMEVCRCMDEKVGRL